MKICFQVGTETQSYKFTVTNKRKSCPPWKWQLQGRGEQSQTNGEERIYTGTGKKKAERQKQVPSMGRHIFWVWKHIQLSVYIFYICGVIYFFNSFQEQNVTVYNFFCFIYLYMFCTHSFSEIHEVHKWKIFVGWIFFKNFNIVNFIKGLIHFSAFHVNIKQHKNPFRIKAKSNWLTFGI